MWNDLNAIPLRILPWLEDEVYLLLTDLFTQAPVRMGQRLASRCLRLDFLHTTSRWVWLLLPRRLIPSVNMYNNTHCLNFWRIIPPPHNLPFITLQSPRGTCCEAPEGLGHSDLGAPDKGDRPFSTSAIQRWGNKTPHVPQGNVLMRFRQFLCFIMGSFSFFGLWLNQSACSCRCAGFRGDTAGRGR